jgi:uncharacterized protein YbjT (DUF2867 family)
MMRRVIVWATGLQGGAVARHLLEDCWHVRGLTRDTGSRRARVLRALGAEVAQGEMGDAASLRPVLEGAYGVYSVQSPFVGGSEGGVRTSPMWPRTSV